MLVAGPVLGFFIGRWLDGKFDTEPYLMVILVLLGLVASGKESYKILKQVTKEAEDQEDADDEFRT